jgi:hypothetical protein
MATTATKSTDPVLSVPMIAKRYRVKEDTVRAWIKANLLPAVDVSNPASQRPLWRVSEADLIEFRKRRSPQPTEPTKRRKRKSQIREYV